MKSHAPKKIRVAGFTLVEVMITIAIIAILAAVALPSYFDYVTRSRLVEAKTSLVDMRTRLEQYFLDNRAFPATPCTAIPPMATKFFTVTCATSGSTYTVTATGKDSMAGFVFTIDQANAKTTTGLKTGWGTAPKSCWISRKNDDC
jgi:type IV pilus assembly protein PilE